MKSGVVPGGSGCAMADQITLCQPGGTDYAHLITTGTPRFSDLPTALPHKTKKKEINTIYVKDCTLRYTCHVHVIY